MENKEVPKECAVKVFKTTLNEFKTRERYIKDDHRFKDRMGKQNPRKTIKLWAEKEMCNLMRLVSLVTLPKLSKHGNYSHRRVSESYTLRPNRVHAVAKNATSKSFRLGIEPATLDSFTSSYMYWIRG